MANVEPDLAVVVGGAHIRQGVGNRVLLTIEESKVKPVFKAFHYIVCYCRHECYPHVNTEDQTAGREGCSISIETASCLWLNLVPRSVSIAGS